MSESPEEANRRDRAHRDLIERLRAQKPMNAGRWAREKLYERDAWGWARRERQPEANNDKGR
jgi:hypothetical protein